MIPWRVPRFSYWRSSKSPSCCVHHTHTHTFGRIVLSSPVASLLLQSPKTRPEIGIAGVKHHTLLENSFQWLLKHSFGHPRDARYADWLLLCCLFPRGGSGHRKFSACSRVERVKTMFALTMHFFLFNSGLKSGRTGGHTEIFEPKARSSEKVLVLNLKIVRRKTKIYNCPIKASFI